MKFYGEPNLLVRVTNQKKGVPKALRFDNNGEYETDNKYLKKRMKVKFKYDLDNYNLNNNDLDYINMSYKELQQCAKEQGIRYIGIKKQDLIMQLEVK